jgi:hypothetical protein
MKVPKKVIGTVLATGVVGALLLVPLPSAWGGIWQSKLLDFGHVPLFGALALTLWLLLGPSLIWPVGLSLSEAGLAEIFQQLVGRTGDWLDFVRGGLGIFAAAAAVAAWQYRRKPLWLLGGSVASVGLLAWPVWDAGPYLLDAYEGYRAFPVLAEFRTDRELLRWICRQATITRTPDPSDPDSSGATLEFREGSARYPNGRLLPILRDYRAYRWLCCSFTVEQAPLNLVTSVRDGADAEGRTSHFQHGRRYEPGNFLVRIDLREGARAAYPRPLDLSDVWVIQFFTPTPKEAGTLRLQRIWLE